MTADEARDNRCTLCGETADVLAGIWDGGGPFSSPTGWACRKCRPVEFDFFDGFGGTQ